MGSQQQGSSSAAPGWVPPRVDVSVPHPARRYDYWLGGKDNFAADRESGDAVAASFPTIRTAVLENRGFLHRAVGYLAGEAGIRQFLDVGTGIPTSPNVHEIAQAVDPATRVVYVDNDPVVLAHARARLTSSATGATAYVDADLRQPEKILDAPQLQAALDFRRPIGLLVVAVVHFIKDAEDPYGIVARLVAAMPAGSYLVMSHATSDYLPPELQAEIAAGRHGSGQLRSRAEFERFFDGLELVEPGVVSVSDWRADAAPRPRPAPADVAVFGAVARIG